MASPVTWVKLNLTYRTFSLPPFSLPESTPEFTIYFEGHEVEGFYNFNDLGVNDGKVYSGDEDGFYEKQLANEVYYAYGRWVEATHTSYLEQKYTITDHKVTLSGIWDNSEDQTGDDVTGTVSGFFVPEEDRYLKEYTYTNPSYEWVNLGNIDKKIGFYPELYSSDYDHLIDFVDFNDVAARAESGWNWHGSPYFAGDANNLVILPTLENASKIKYGSGADVFSYDGFSFDAGSGDDEITFRDAVSGAILDGGEGDDTLVLSGAFADYKFFDTVLSVDKTVQSTGVAKVEAFAPQFKIKNFETLYFEGGGETIRLSDIGIDLYQGDGRKIDFNKLSDQQLLKLKFGASFLGDSGGDDHVVLPFTSTALAHQLPGRASEIATLFGTGSETDMTKMNLGLGMDTYVVPYGSALNTRLVADDGMRDRLIDQSSGKTEFVVDPNDIVRGFTPGDTIYIALENPVGDTAIAFLGSATETGFKTDFRKKDEDGVLGESVAKFNFRDADVDFRNLYFDTIDSIVLDDSPSGPESYLKVTYGKEMNPIHAEDIVALDASLNAMFKHASIEVLLSLASTFGGNGLKKSFKKYLSDAKYSKDTKDLAESVFSAVIDTNSTLLSRVSGDVLKKTIDPEGTTDSESAFLTENVATLLGITGSVLTAFAGGGPLLVAGAVMGSIATLNSFANIFADYIQSVDDIDARALLKASGKTIVSRAETEDDFAFVFGADADVSLIKVKNGIEVGFLHRPFTEKQNLKGNGLGNQLYGSDGDNKITGAGGHDAIFGYGGDDTLVGGNGNDKMSGGAGKDTLWGGKGKDRLVGGEGADTFKFGKKDAPKTKDEADFIKDFRHKVDKIDLSRIDADATMPGNQKLDFIGNRKFSDTAGELRFKKKFVYGDTDGDREADFVIKVNTGTLEAADFIL